MSQIKDLYNPGPGRHWFDPSSMRFFRTQLPSHGFHGPGGIYFVSSEQFVDGRGVAAPRRYTVRQLDGGSIETIGPFNELDETEATELARKMASGEKEGA